MNKVAKTLCMMAVVALAFTACKKEDAKTDTIPFNYTVQTLAVENESSFDKVYVDNGQVTFESGDAITLFNIKANPTNSDPSQLDIFTVQPNLIDLVGQDGLDATTDGNYYGFYPGTAVGGGSLLASNRATFTLNATQNYRVVSSPNFPLPANSLYMAAKDETHTTLTETVYNFQNICGILSMRFYSPSGKKVKSIAITDRKFNLVGDVTLRIDKVDPVQMITLFNNYSEDAAYQAELANYLYGPDGIDYVTDHTSPTVTLKCGSEGVQLGTTETEATTFFVVLRPLALRNGFDAVVTFTDGTTHNIASSRNNIITPNVIRVMTVRNVG